MISLKNNTSSPSIIGKVVVIDPRSTGSFIYASTGATKVLGVTTEAVAPRKPCLIAVQGERANVLVQGNPVVGSIIRLAKSIDRVSSGSCVIAKTGDAPYLKVGDVISIRNGYVQCVLEFTYAGDAYGTGYVPYSGATQDVDLGTHKLSSGSAEIGSATDYVNIDANGNLSLEGDATVWDDLRILYGVVDVPGGTDPDIVDWQPGGSGTTFKVYAFAKGDQFFFTQQLPHDYKEGSDIYPHVHWTPAARGNEESGNTVQWRLDYSITNHHEVFIASQTVPLPGVCSGVDHTHEKTAAGTISGVGLEISSQLIGRFYRYNDASDTWVGTGADLPVFLELDFHYQKDSIGSKTITVK